MGKKLKVNGLWTQFLDPLIGREPFDTHGALYGALTDGPSFIPFSDRLPEHYVDSFYGSSYAVYSYGTPIAWLNEDGVWICPDVKYSVTTSKHQGRIFTAISAMVK